MSASTLALSLLRLACRLKLPGRYLLLDAVAPSLASSKSILAPVGRRLKVACDLRDSIQRQVAFGLYEPDKSRVFLAQLRPGDTVLDIGANVGYYSLLAAEAVGAEGRVYAIEPIEANLNVLRSNAARNDLQNIETCFAAIGDR